MQKYTVLGTETFQGYLWKWYLLALIISSCLSWFIVPVFLPSFLPCVTTEVYTFLFKFTAQVKLEGYISYMTFDLVFFKGSQKE